MNSCGVGSQNQINNGLPTVEFQTVTLAQGNVVANVDRDVLVKFRGAYRFFMLTAITAAFANSDIFLHFFPLRLPTVNGTNVISPTGGEQWIPLSNIANSSARCEGRWIKFNREISQFYIDADHNGVQSATPYLITFMGTDDIEMALSERQ